MIFSDIHDFYRKIKGRKLAFIGIGISHSELIRRTAQAGALVTLCDKRFEKDIPEASELKQMGVALSTGEGYLDNIDADIVFRTPGMYFNHPKLLKLRQNGVCVTSEMELFFRLCPCKIYAITGSDGKTTTSNLIACMLKESGKTVHLGGNLGRALLPVCDSISPDDAAVVELSSFQLISMRQSPDVAVITNVSPNHLDVHRDMKEYIDSKRNIYLHQDGFGTLVLNRDNDITFSMQDEARGAVRWFSYSKEADFTGSPQVFGAFLSGDGNLMFKDAGGTYKIMHKNEIRIPGEHNVENMLTAISAVGGEVDFDVIKRVAREFAGVEHRIELVRTLDGVRYYNDSIASSPTRTIAGLKSFDQKVILIAGGYDKHIPYEPLAPYIKQKVKLLITMGDTAQKIEDAVKNEDTDLPLPEIVRVENMQEAVCLAHRRAAEADIVLMSPASASFDKYKNFEARGRHFKELVAAL